MTTRLLTRLSQKLRLARLSPLYVVVTRIEKKNMQNARKPIIFL